MRSLAHFDAAREERFRVCRTRGRQVFCLGAVNSVDDPPAALTPPRVIPNAPSSKRRRLSAARFKETSMPASAAAEKLEAEKANTTFARDQLKAVIERIERLEEEKKATSDDIRDVYAEAKGNGFDVKALRTIVRLRKLDTDERREQEAVLETYMHALGMVQ
jgi:uncharacterized protein (UPF0335 family)